MSVSGSVVADHGVPPEVVEADGASHNIGVVELMVVADPGSDESPEGLDSWVSAESANFLWFSLYTIQHIRIRIEVVILTENWSIPHVSWSKLGSEWGVALLVEVRYQMRHVCYLIKINN